jgi:predicted ester cyclase
VAAADVETLVRGFFGEALNGHDLEAFPRFCGPDYVWHGSSNPDGSGTVVGLAPFARAVASFFEAFPDLRATVLDVIAHDDRAAVRFCETGTHEATFMGVAPTRRVLRWDGIAIYRAQDGLLVEEWSVGDNLSLLRQIDAVAPANGAAL